MRALIAYFSRADQNYFSGALRTVKVGNTEIVAELLEELTGADRFKINPIQPYSRVHRRSPGRPAPGCPARTERVP